MKVFDRSLDANRDERAIERAVEIELAAQSAVLAMPAPRLDEHRQVLAEVEGELVRVHEWVVGWSPDSGPAGAELAGQVGEWLARLHQLALPPASAGLRGLDTVSDVDTWRRLVDRVTAERHPVAAALTGALGHLDRAVDLVRSRPRDGDVIGTHRDLFPRNALVTAGGLSVCDWDVAGPWLAEEEIAAAAVDWSGGILGPVDAESFLAVLDGYRSLGGEPPAAEPEMWAGYLAKQLNWLEMHVRRVLDPPTPQAGAVAAHRLPFLVPRLVRQVDELPRWVELVGIHRGPERPGERADAERHVSRAQHRGSETRAGEHRDRGPRARTLTAMPESIPVQTADGVLDQVTYNDDGLVPAIVQEEGTGKVLMMAWMNDESLGRTLETGRTWFWSRSRQEYWCKGETSGNRQFVREAYYDCDGDTLLFVVEQEGDGACHTGEYSCFFRSFDEPVPST